MEATGIESLLFTSDSPNKAADLGTTDNGDIKHCAFDITINKCNNFSSDDCQL